MRFQSVLLRFALLSAVMSGCDPGRPLSDARADESTIVDGSDRDLGAESSDVVVSDQSLLDASASTDASDGAPFDALFTPDAGCSLLGTYRATLGGMTIYFRFEASGQYEAAASVAELDTAPFNSGQYSFDPGAGTLTFTQDTFCSTAVGRYHVDFSAMCGVLTFTLQSDPCPGRAFNGLMATRV